MGEDSRPVRIERRNNAWWITIAREERRNAINEAVIGGIVEGIRSAMADPEARAIVLTGAGNKAFCAGADLQPGTAGSAFEVDLADPRHFMTELFRLIETCDLPLVARVNGHVRAGGMGLLCMCDMAVATNTATFGTPETNVGLFPMMILPYMLRVLPRRKLLEMCITGEPFSAEEALAMGLVNYLAPPPELDQKVEWLLERILNKSPSAIAFGKYAFRSLQDMPLLPAFSYAETNIRLFSMTKDAREGIRAFAEKRPPRWEKRSPRK